MAIGDPYIGLPELKVYLQFEPSFAERDADILAAAMAATEAIDNCCDRQFNRSDVASERLYEPTMGGRLLVDDFWTTDGLSLVSELGGTWTAADLDLRPHNGIVNSRSGWPFYEIRTMLHSFPLHGSAVSVRSAVRVTAKWGWAEVPGPIRQATKILAGQLFKLSDAPLGVAGFNQFGAAIRVRDMPPQVRMLISPYERNKVLVG